MIRLKSTKRMRLNSWIIKSVGLFRIHLFDLNPENKLKNDKKEKLSENICFKVNTKELRSGWVTIEDLQNIMSSLNIFSEEDLRKATDEGKIKIPQYPAMNAICLEKKGVGFYELFNIKRKDKLREKLMRPDFKEELRIWCYENNITSVSGYINSDKPKRFPSAERIRQLYGTEYFYHELGFRR
jgi:hypothetical protein